MAHSSCTGSYADLRIGDFNEFDQSPEGRARAAYYAQLQGVRQEVDEDLPEEGDAPGSDDEDAPAIEGEDEAFDSDPEAQQEH